MESLKQAIFFTAIFWVILFLTSCSNFIGPSKVSVPLIKLQAKLDEKFPLKHSFPPFIELRLANPTLLLQPEKDRLQLRLNTTLSMPLTHQIWSGQLSISGGLGFDKQKNALVLLNPTIDKLIFDEASTNTNIQLSMIGKTIAEYFVKDPILYTFPSEKMYFAGKHYQPNIIEIEKSAIMINFMPAP